MISGIYAAEFFSNLAQQGTGVAVFTDNTFHGGDATHFYKGKYKRNGTDEVEAIVDVAQYAGTSGSSVVNLDRFRVKLQGKTSEKGTDVRMTLEGVVEAHPSMKIAIQLRRLDDLVEA